MTPRRRAANYLTVSAPWARKTLVTALEKIKAGLTPQKQDDAQATMAPPLTKDMARFDFTQDAAHIHNWVAA